MDTNDIIVGKEDEDLFKKLDDYDEEIETLAEKIKNGAYSEQEKKAFQEKTKEREDFLKKHKDKLQADKFN